VDGIWRSGGSDFIHAEMTTSQLLRAVAVAQRGELVAARELLQYALTEGNSVDLAALSACHREFLDLPYAPKPPQTVPAAELVLV
jgi:hypothetical protein